MSRMKCTATSDFLPGTRLYWSINAAREDELVGNDCVGIGANETSMEKVRLLQAKEPRRRMNVSCGGAQRKSSC